MIKLETPLTIEKVESLRVGDQVLLSGTIYTGRDAAHKRFVEAINNNEPLPFDLMIKSFTLLVPHLLSQVILLALWTYNLLSYGCLFPYNVVKGIKRNDW